MAQIARTVPVLRKFVPNRIELLTRRSPLHLAPFSPPYTPGISFSLMRKRNHSPRFRQYISTGPFDAGHIANFLIGCLGEYSAGDGNRNAELVINHVLRPLTQSQCFALVRNLDIE